MTRPPAQAQLQAAKRRAEEQAEEEARRARAAERLARFDAQRRDAQPASPRPQWPRGLKPAPPADEPRREGAGATSPTTTSPRCRAGGRDRRVADHDPNPFLSDVTDSVDWLQRQFDSNDGVTVIWLGRDSNPRQALSPRPRTRLLPPDDHDADQLLQQAPTSRGRHRPKSAPSAASSWATRYACCTPCRSSPSAPRPSEPSANDWPRSCRLSGASR